MFAKKRLAVHQKTALGRGKRKKRMANAKRFVLYANAKTEKTKTIIHVARWKKNKKFNL